MLSVAKRAVLGGKWNITPENLQAILAAIKMIVQEIIDALAKQGVPLSEDAIRKEIAMRMAAIPKDPDLVGANGDWLKMILHFAAELLPLILPLILKDNPVPARQA